MRGLLVWHGHSLYALRTTQLPEFLASRRPLTPSIKTSLQKIKTLRTILVARQFLYEMTHHQF